MPASDSPDPKPPTRALETERDAAIARLQDAAVAGRLELEALDERLGMAMRARSVAEIDALVADLASPQAAPQVVVSGALAVAPQAALAPEGSWVAAERPSPERLTAIFSGIDKKGRRTLPRRMRARAVFGGISLDLREATFQPGTTVIRCASVFGGVDITVPAHVRIECDGSGIFGGFDADESDGYGTASGPEAPVLRVEGKAVFGGVSVRRAKPTLEGIPLR